MLLQGMGLRDRHLVPGHKESLQRVDTLAQRYWTRPARLSQIAHALPPAAVERPGPCDLEDENWEPGWASHGMQP